MIISHYDNVILFHRGGIGYSVHDIGIIDALIRNGAQRIIYISIKKNKWILNNFLHEIIFIEAGRLSFLKNILTLFKIVISNHIILCSAGTNIKKINRIVKFTHYNNLFGVTDSKFIHATSNNYMLLDYPIHRVEANSKLLSFIGLNDCNTVPVINLKNILKNELLSLKLHNLTKESYIVLHNGADKNLKAKKINENYFMELLNFLTYQLNLKVIILGGENEVDFGNALNNLSNTGIVNLIGETNIAQTIYLVSRSSCVIGPDSMIGHLAAALCIPTISFFGPTDPAVVKPYSDMSDIISNDPNCGPCYSTEKFKCCPNHNMCMNNFNFKELTSKLEKIQGIF